MRALLRRQPFRRSPATPELRQGEAAECGLAALGILLAHHGRPVPLEQLRAEAGSTRLGVTARTLIRIARHHGMDARAFRKEPDGLAALGFPLIAHSRFVHFLVVEAIDGDELRVNDPAAGPLRLSWDEFAESFTGIAITVRPPTPGAPAVVTGWRPLSLPRDLKRRLAPQRGLVAAILVLSALTRAAAVAAALAAGAWVDDTGGRAGPTLVLALATAVITGWMGDRLTATLGARLAGSTAAGAFDRLLRLSPLCFARRSTAQVLAAPLAGGALQRRIGAVLALAELPLLALPLLAGLLVDGWAGAASGATTLAALALLGLVHGRRGGWVARLGSGAPAPLVPDPGTLAALGSHKTGGRDGELFAQLAGRHAFHITAAQTAAAGHAGLTALRAGLTMTGVALTVALGLAGVADGRLGVGAVVALAGLALAAHRPLGRLDRALPAVQALKDALHRLDDAESVPAEPDPPPLAGRPAARLCFEDSGFQPSPLAPPVLAGVTLRLEPGQRLGILGPSGSGKSVLAKLACGLLAADAGTGVPGGALGRVLLDGEPVAVVARRRPGAVALVDRSSPLTAGTVADTLRLGDGRPGDARLDNAALAAALDLVGLTADLAPRGGLALPLTRGGAELSGGQRRRLALARALLRDPVLLVIDEALDALEPALARRILDRVGRPDRVVLVVSRRPETLEGCDHLLRLGMAEAVP